ncbi:MAG: cytochrome c oxidase subunit 3 family protein [Novosphingobium sp.]|nr:cytochrome c oxidase subunit 3 family protein [Novosphingobium sp.]MCP5379948.1 cytochrome c oxidase subunit 3 family protein [Novosphingobium sp.]MCP5389039.1 cytochrome c oxidase subunit 3 family protein [Novosphingobium sp.]
MSDEQSALQQSGRAPGDPGVWFFIIADMAMFAIFFLIFMAGRHEAPELYRASQAHLDSRFGLANTLILLTSGACMAKAVMMARAGDVAITLRYLLLTLGIGLLFGVSKVMEYGTKFAAGIAINTNEFFGYYFAFTGIHFLHWIIGCGVLTVLIRRVRRSGVNAENINWIESGGIYWHMVDLLWVMLFAMIYLLPPGGTA